MVRTHKTWTNQSVLGLARGRDPVASVLRKARDIVIEALDAGWTGPPYDPRKLAELRRIDVLPRGDIRDAQLVMAARDKPRIEYNPNRPLARLRYSIAHEIAHTLFPDFAKQVRRRMAREEAVADEWEVEALCNIAAAELLMPLGSFRGPSKAELTIERLLELREEYGVSTEALLIRSVGLTGTPCAMFAASHVEGGRHRGKYRIDYSIGSRTWKDRIPPGLHLPEASCVGHCRAILHTAKAEEVWPSPRSPLHIECVGIPPYPGSRWPRVVGIASNAAEEVGDMRRIRYVVGDAVNPVGIEPRVIAHVVNDRARSWGGRGFAQALRRRWEYLHRHYREWAARGSTNLQLGNVLFSLVEEDLTVASMVAQRGYGASLTQRIRYGALEECLQEIAERAAQLNATVHMPRIGAGQAGGSWNIVAELLLRTLIAAGIEVTVYDLPGTQTSEGQMELGFST